MTEPYAARFARGTAGLILETTSSAYISNQGETALTELTRYLRRTDPAKEPDNYKAAYDALQILRTALGTDQSIKKIGSRLFNQATKTLFELLRQRPQDKLSELKLAWRYMSDRKGKCELQTSHGRKKIVCTRLQFAEIEYETSSDVNPLKPVLKPFEEVLDAMDAAHTNHANLETLARDIQQIPPQYPLDYTRFAVENGEGVVRVRAYLIKPTASHQ